MTSRLAYEIPIPDGLRALSLVNASVLKGTLPDRL